MVMSSFFIPRASGNPEAFFSIQSSFTQLTNDAPFLEKKLKELEVI